MFCRLFCSLFFAAQYFFFSFFQKCSKFMALSDTSRMFLSCYCFFPFLCYFLFNTQNPGGYSFRMYRHSYLDSLKRPLATTNSSSVSTSFFSCIALRSLRSFGYHTKMALACFLKFFRITV